MAKKYLDLLERTGWTAVQAFLGVLIAMATAGPEVQWDTVLAAAGIAAGLAAGKALLAFQFSNPDSAALPETEPAPAARKR